MAIRTKPGKHIMDMDTVPTVMATTTATSTSVMREGSCSIETLFNRKVARQNFPES